MFNFFCDARGAKYAFNFRFVSTVTAHGQLNYVAPPEYLAEKICKGVSSLLYKSYFNLLIEMYF